MNGKTSLPPSRSHRFVWVIVAVVLIAVMAIAVVVVQGRAGETAADVEVSYVDGAVTARSDEATESTPVVDIFSDFSCSHCATLAEATSDELRQAVTAGDLVVNFRFLNFLDGDAAADGDGGGVGPSTRAASAVLALGAAGDAEAFWELHDQVFFDQRTVMTTWGDGEFAEAAEGLGADPTLVDAIRDGSVREAHDDAFRINTNELQRRAGQVATPMVFRGDDQIELRRDPATGAMVSWIPEVVPS